MQHFLECVTVLETVFGKENATTRALHVAGCNLDLEENELYPLTATRKEGDRALPPLSLEDMKKLYEQRFLCVPAYDFHNGLDAVYTFIIASRHELIKDDDNE